MERIQAQISRLQKRLAAIPGRSRRYSNNGGTDQLGADVSLTEILLERSLDLIDDLNVALLTLKKLQGIEAPSDFPNDLRYGIETVAALVADLTGGEDEQTERYDVSLSREDMPSLPPKSGRAKRHA